jgi:triphosphoribosyl-dephospho-CoA synthetase
MKLWTSSVQSPDWNGKCFGKRGLAGVPAAGILLLIAGLSRIIDAIKESRGNFQRMNNRERTLHLVRQGDHPWLCRSASTRQRRITQPGRMAP